MYDLVLQIVLMGSLAAIVYISVLALDRVEEPSSRINKFRAWVNSLPYHHVDEAIETYKDKFLRKAKIIVLKIENSINKNLNKDKDGSGLGGPQI